MAFRDDATARLVASAHRALWGAIPPTLRAVSVEAASGTLCFRCVFDGTPSDDDRDLLSAAATEVIADFQAGWGLNEENLSIPFPGPMEHLKQLVFLRHEPVVRIDGRVETPESLWKVLEGYGAAWRYSKLLHLITIEDLEPFFPVAATVTGKPTLLEPLIVNPDWRISIVATAVAALLRSPQLVPSLNAGLEQDSWIAPQLSAAIVACADERSDLSGLRGVLAREDLHSNVKTVMSAYAALSLRRDAAAVAFAERDDFPMLWRADQTHCHELVCRWTGIWSIAGPYYRRRCGRSDA